MIQINKLSKTFKLYASPADRLKELFLRRCYHREFQVLQQISLRVRPGETLGIIGRNGAGKSTLLKILTGVMIPDQGEIIVNGRITGLLELGTGFNPEFSGRANIFLNGAYLGLSHAEISQRLKAIIDFSELGDFIDEPLKTFSSGMVMRLAFATAIHADPRAFVVDEALSVGDAYFQHKCISRIKQFKNDGGAIIFVSHDLNAVKILCDRALLLEQGEILEEGDPEDIINSYNFLIARLSQGAALKQVGSDKSRTAYGNQLVHIDKVELKLDANTSTEVFISGRPALIGIHLTTEIEVGNLTLGILIRDKFGQDMFGTNTYLLNFPLEMNAASSRVVYFSFPALNLGPGKYSLTTAIHTQATHLDTCFHWIDKARSFEVVHSGDYLFSGICRLVPEVFAA